LIAVDSRGNIVLPCNCEGMYRGAVTENDDFVIDIYRD
jgi:isoaspartyl peptidase/L-asparaginase-like protein (Ntn-hydrolase superfamily)